MKTQERSNAFQRNFIVINTSLTTTGKENVSGREKINETTEWRLPEGLTALNMNTFNCNNQVLIRCISQASKKVEGACCQA